jgi:hypothetical protein
MIIPCSPAKSTGTKRFTAVQKLGGSSRSISSSLPHFRPVIWSRDYSPADRTRVPNNLRAFMAGRIRVFSSASSVVHSRPSRGWIYDTSMTSTSLSFRDA